MTVTFGAFGEFIFTIEPFANPRLSGAFNLGLTAGLELYGGIGSGWLASIGIYGPATVGTEMAVLPQFSLDRLYISGEVGLKAKVLGRDVFTFTFTSGTKELIEKAEEDGTISYTTLLCEGIMLYRICEGASSLALKNLVLVVCQKRRRIGAFVMSLVIVTRSRIGG